MEDYCEYSAPPGFVHTRRNAHGFVCHHVQSIKLIDGLDIHDISRPGGTAPKEDLQYLNDYLLPKERIRLRKKIPEAATDCMSEDIETARRGFIRYLGLLSDALFAIGCMKGEAPIHRLRSAFWDAQAGAQGDLFKSSGPPHRLKKGYAYQDMMGLACALINALDREKGMGNVAAANAVARHLDDLKIPWPAEGREKRSHSKRLLDRFYRMQREAQGYELRRSDGPSGPCWQLYCWNKRKHSWEFAEEAGEIKVRAIATYVGNFTGSSEQIRSEMEDAAHNYGLSQY